MAQFLRKDFVYSYENYIVNGKFDRVKAEKDARKVAKSVNQRLVRLEQAGLTSSPAYRGALKALQGGYTMGEVPEFASTGKKPRYRENVKNLSDNALRALLYAASRTSQASTSTAGAVNALYGDSLKRLQDMADKKVNLNVNDVMEIFKNKALVEFNKLFGYNYTMTTIDKLMERTVIEEIDGKTVERKTTFAEASEQFKKAMENIILSQLGGEMYTEYIDSKGRKKKKLKALNIQQLNEMLGISNEKIDITQDFESF